MPDNEPLLIERDGGVLTLSESFTANLEAYDATRYGGFTAIPGTLTLRVRTSSASL